MGTGAPFTRMLTTVCHLTGNRNPTIKNLPNPKHDNVCRLKKKKPHTIFYYLLVSKGKWETGDF